MSIIVYGDHGIVTRAPPRYTGDVAFDGDYYIAGSAPDGLASIDGVPGRVEIYLIDRNTMRAVRKAWSDRVTGEYKIDAISERVWMVLGVDPTGEHNAVVMDHITPAEE